MKFFRSAYRSPAVQVSAAIVFLIVDLIFVGMHFELGKSDWAGWVQSIGATAAVAIAIYVPWRQAKLAAIAELNRRTDSARRVCMAFRDELDVLRENIGRTNVSILLDIPTGGIFENQIASPKNRFPIFNAMVGRITEIDEDLVRKGIIETYEALNGLMDIGLLNNKLLLEYRDLLSVVENNGDSLNRALLENNRQALVALCAQMKNLAKILIERINFIVPLLNSILK